MNNSSGSIFELPFLKISSENKGPQLEKHKLIPPKEKYYINRLERESEWQQEYFIIYNSYTLDKK